VFSNDSAESISTTGNITAAAFVGDGSQLTGITVDYGNANVANYLPTYSGDVSASNITVSGNVTAAYLIGDGSQITGLAANYGNADVANYLPTFAGNLSGSRLDINDSAGNAWVMQGQSMTVPSGGERRTENDSLDDYITSEANG
jgi:hypothetical protein